MFIIIAIIPAIKTQTMRFVDIAWPWGLVFIAIFSFIYGSAPIHRKCLICSCYLLQGLRMGMSGILTIPKMKEDFPRYEYIKMKIQSRGKHLKLSIMVDIMLQCMANCGLLTLPLIIIAFDKTKNIQTLELIFYLYFWMSIIFETIADLQKNNFINKCKKNGQTKSICNVGLWKYSRHPNYFGEWNVWNSYILWTLYLIYNQYVGGQLQIFQVIGFSYFTISISFAMYNCLVYWTGCKPAEYYSLKKRPEYAQYQKNTNMFFPWFQNKIN